MSGQYNILYFDVNDTGCDDSDKDADEFYADDEDYDLAMVALILLGSFAGIHGMN